MSAGLGMPSTTVSPCSTCSPSNTTMWRHFGTSTSLDSPSASVITRRCLPLVSLPKLTVPLTSASSDASLGLRASNSSATRGRPPVMSRVFEDSWGRRAMASPIPTLSPS